MLNSQLICYHRDKLTVSWLRLTNIDRIAEQVANAVDIASPKSMYHIQFSRYL